MFKNSEAINRDIDSSDVNSDDAAKFSGDESDDENPPRSFVNPSYNEKQMNSYNANYTASGSNGHPNNATRETGNWSSTFSVQNSYYFQSRLNERAHPLKINLSKVKKVRIKKPSIGISRSKPNSSSPYNINFVKKRPKSTQSNAVRKRPPAKSRQKSPLFAASGGLNGLSDECTVVTSNAEPNSNQVPRLPMVPPPYSWANNAAKDTGNASDDDETNVGEYAQYLELKPSVKFKCYRCGANDFGTMASLQSHIATCSGPARNDANHSSPVRTMKPSTAPPTAGPNLRITRQVYLCSSCGTYYQNYNLYIHMRDKHNKQICLYCRSIFARSEQLWDHLVTVHKLASTAYTSVSQIKDAFKNSFFITCCSCNTIFSDNEPFNEHNCEVGSNLAAVDMSLCTNCKPSAAASAERSPRRESVSSHEDDDELKAEFPDEFMSRNSTLDFIGVPEEHTVTSQPDEDEMDNVVESQTVPEKVVDPEPVKVDDLNPVQVDDVVPVTPPLESYQTEAAVESEDDDDQKTTAIDADEHLPSPHSNGDNSVCELESVASVAMEPESVATNEMEHDPPASNATEASQSNAELPVDENYGHYNASVHNVVPNVKSTFTSSDDDNAADVFLAHPPKADTVAVEVDEPVPNHLDTNCAETEDLKPLIETPPPEPVDATPSPLPMALMLDETVDSLSVLTLINECVKTSCLSCLYCSNAMLIAVNGANLVSHLLTEHRFMPTKHEDDSQMVIQKLESGAQDLVSVHMNASHSSHREILFDGTFSCLQCSFTTPLYKDLCNHKRRTHHKSIFLCIMCKCNFQFYSQLLCHLCPGSYLSESVHTLTYHCCFCDVDVIPSAFRLMVHLRKVHQACDICLSQHADQSELYTHMIKQHKISHLCYKCNLAWRSRDDINKHLFWKHGTESVLCKRCLQKKWPHAYHFCIPASTYTCDECSRIFSKAVALTVHRRAHNGEFPFACDLCEQRCISKKLLAAHKETVHQIMREPQPEVHKEEQPAEESAQNEAEQQPPNEAPSGNDENKEHRSSKKKRKKAKNGNEKPLLDELPPLNLSSESEDESADEEQLGVKSEAPSVSAEPADAASASTPPLLAGDDQPEQSATPVDVPDTAASEDERQEVCAILNELAVAAVAAAQPATGMVTPTEENSVKAAEVPVPEETSAENADRIEKMLNCLIVEHSYCIPDCIFRSSDAANQSAMSDGSDNAVSGKQRSKRDKSCSKSITPRKRKHPPKKESSSSESSSDSDSSSSSCGSNCSCNSSSSSSESTTPEKRTTGKKKSARSSSKEKSSANTTADGGAAGEHSLLSVPESDLDTEITASDEDFYEEHPFYVPPPPPIEPEPPVAPLPYENRLTISREATPRNNECRSKKRRKKPKITINFGGLQRSYKPPKTPQSRAANLSMSSLDHRISSSSSYSSTPNTSAALYHASAAASYTNCVSSTTGSATLLALPSGSGGGDSSGRLSKRKRVKNRFYGYSSSDDSGGGGGGGLDASSTSLKTTIQLKKRPPSKKPKSRQPFVGIRAKRPPGLLIRPPAQSQQRSPSISSTTAGYASASSNMYRAAPHSNNVYHQQQRTFLKPVVPSSSDDSDSDEKRHKLVINLPVPKEKQQQPNSQLSYGFANAGSLLGSGGGSREPQAGVGWFNQRASSQQLQPPNAQSTPTKKEIYCFCRCPYDEVSEMIACDAPNCPIEWFHFECVGIMAAPQGQWFCPNCRKNPENMSRSF